MKPALVQWLQCPKCSGALAIEPGPQREDQEIETGQLICGCGSQYPVVRGIPRFVEHDRYTKSFSFQWQTHRKTQLDRCSGLTVSRDKFQSQMDVPLEWLRGKRVLDVGCGSGRFMDVALAHGAEVVGIDLSFAVDAARENLSREPRAHFLQADVYALPFKPESFDLVFSFGVLHHTPDCRRAFLQLPKLVKPGGKLAICLYSGYERVLVYSGNFWRTILNKLPPKLLYAFCHVAVPLYYLYRVPVVGQVGKAIFNISMQPDWRWRVLDTFDWYSPRFQSAHTHHEVFQWFDAAGLADMKVLEYGVSMLGHRPAAAEPAEGREAVRAGETQTW